MVQKRFQYGVNIAKTRRFPGADTGSDHELVMMTFQLHLKEVSKQGHIRMKFDLEKLKDPDLAGILSNQKDRRMYHSFK